MIILLLVSNVGGAIRCKGSNLLRGQNDEECGGI